MDTWPAPTGTETTRNRTLREGGGNDKAEHHAQTSRAVRPEGPPVDLR
ncbi:hypothetical protein GSU3215 [Geobacter sulfurreducens PCA]|uniref:Uncharacterized protein n=1 Tax=Geobacter sulfurreducens (strain ATCC 51573 / DSM 12127 / PCA) TaxID=243231 RepID=Q747Q0_GEOSL|nr:hypothetical protein GSU3215 [Geobacter sulfurreducens PCA]ADN78410.1 hypothetical protein KN400_3521 [Geobacter sulfurreducens KN400]AJY69445.1 hypothetical protein RW64_07390 [Geobacter sulfurreducens]HBB70557.1 hypothetical protein [Geobacter sulfurreducens]HCD95472.1 hypothetical protein [Geobacter sulfurreducens]